MKRGVQLTLLRWAKRWLRRRVSPGVQAARQVRVGAVLLGLLAVLCLPRLAWAQGEQEKQSPMVIRALFIKSFFQHTEWPQDATNRTAPRILGILGEDPLGDPVITSMKQQTVSNRSIEVKKLSTANEAKGCHVVFVNLADKKKVTQYLDELKDLSILTVGELEGFTRLGGIINFTLDETKRFEWSKKAYERSALKIDSPVLAVGKKVP